ncbi:MAG TPA: FliH/SctL family protein [Pirellulales bacterium]|nr:FliH/SctL family protein [Pirellulales bacterium]
MPTVIKATDRQFGERGAAFDVEALARQADAYRATIREQARQILLAAMRDAGDIRHAAELEGRRAAEQAFDRLLDEQVGRRLETVLPALRAVIAEVCDSKQAWLADWERQAVHLAVAIAGRVCRREISNQPEISIGLVREALELASGAGGVRVLLNPDDYLALGGPVRKLASELARLGPAAVVADASISHGGCRVETPKGAVDQQIETRLVRIAEELTC